MDDTALYNTFLDLHNKFGKKGLNIILGGGYGLYLKQLALLSELEVRTLLQVESWPRPRSTSDLDLFFPLELLVSLEEMQSVQEHCLGASYKSLRLRRCRYGFNIPLALFAMVRSRRFRSFAFLAPPRRLWFW